MGIFRKLSAIVKVKKEKITIIVVGLNGSGKSTLINRFKRNTNHHHHTMAKTKAATATAASTATIGPTVGFSVERFRCRGVTFTSFDMSGARRYRSLWEHHLANCHGIVYVIDASDQMRLVVVRDELEQLLRLADAQQRKMPILFYCNKIDGIDGDGGGVVGDANDRLSSAKIVTAIGLEKICQQPWQIVYSNALSGEGLEEGVQWLIEQIRSRN